MKNIANKIYINSPFFIKKILANIEAVRRDSYRKFGDYKNLKKLLAFNEYMSTYSDKDVNQVIEKFNSLSIYANKYVPYYKNNKLRYVEDIMDISYLPTLSKNNIRKDKEKLISEDVSTKDLWNGSSSGSTGTPLKYYRDKNSVRNNQALYDSYYESLGCNLDKKRIRFSGIKLTSFDKVHPPFWVYIDKYKQLQCSVYHLSEANYKHYINKICQLKAEFGTGYPSAWGQLAEYIIEKNIKMPPMKAIITDSEAMDEELQDRIETAFNCKVYHTYGLSEVGMVAMQCKNRNYHIVPKLNYVEIIDNKEEPVDDGEEGQIIVTDLNSKHFPMIRYQTGDRGILGNELCSCGYKTPYLTQITGRIEDYILTRDGRKIQRVSQILKPAVGIKESQIIQKSKNDILIKVVPDTNFEEESMEKVIDNAISFVGDMNVKWESVNSLQRMASGKIKFLIKEYKE